MYKDGGNINIDELYSASTTDTNGLEVLVYVNFDDIGDFVSAIHSQLPFFENVYVNADTLNLHSNYYAVSLDRFNKLKIKEYKTFSVNSEINSSELSLCIGKVYYPLDTKVINTPYKEVLKYPITLKFDIGDINVTPSRESVLYDKGTIEKIQNRLELVYKEIKEISDPHITKDYTSLIKYIENKDNRIYVSLLDTVSISFNNKCTFNKRNLHENSLFTESINYVRDRVKMVIYDAAIHQHLYSIRDIIYVYSNSNVKLLSSNYKRVTRKYIKEYCSSIYFIKSITYISFAKLVLSKVYVNEKNRPYYKLIINELYKELFINNTVFDDSCVPADYIEANKPKRVKSEIKGTGILKIGRLRDSNKATYTGGGNCYSAVPEYEYSNLEDLLKKYKLIIYSSKKDTVLYEAYSLFSRINRYRNNIIVFIEASNTVINQLPKDNKRVLHINDFISMKKYKALRKYATTKYIESNYPYLSTLYGYNCLSEIANISPRLSEILSEIKIYVDNNSKYNSYRMHSDLEKDILSICSKNNYYDEKMVSFINSNIKYIEGCSFISLFVRNGRIDKEYYNIIVDYILARKLFIPNYETVNKIKGDVLLRKNKSNNENNKNK